VFLVKFTIKKGCLRPVIISDGRDARLLLLLLLLFFYY